MGIALNQIRWQKAAIILCWFPFLALCYFNQPYLDDFWSGQIGHDEGLWAAQKHYYFNWGGRFASTFSYVVYNPLSYDWPQGVKLTALLNIVLKISVLWLALRSLTRKHISKTDAFWLASGIALTYVCLVPDKYSTLYFFTDWAVYQLPATFLLMVPVAIDRIHCASTPFNRVKWQAIAIVATIGAAAGNEMTLLLTGWLLLSGLLISLLRKQRRSAVIWTSLLLVLLVAGGIAVTAPGNYERLKTYGATPFPEPLQLVKRILASAKYILTDSSTLLTIALPILLAPLGVRLLPARPAGLRLPLGIGAGLVLVGAVIGAAPYNIIPQPFERPMNVLQWWLLLGWIAACWASLPASHPPVPSKAVRYVVGVALCVAVSINAGRAWGELLFNATSYQQQWLTRYRILEEAKTNGKRIVELPPVMRIQPYHVLIRGYDNQPEYKDVRNISIANWYGLDSVRTSPLLMGQALF